MTELHDGGVGQLVEVILQFVREGQGSWCQYALHHPLTDHVTSYIAHHCKCGDTQAVKKNIKILTIDEFNHQSKDSARLSVYAVRSVYQSCL